MLTLGIDPGQSGAIAVKLSDGGISHHNMPKSFESLLRLLIKMKKVTESKDMRIIIEALNGHDMPAGSAWKMAGEYFKVVHAAQITATEIKMIEPRVWQRKFQLEFGDLPKGKANYSARKTQIWRAMKSRYPSIVPALTKRNADAVAILHTATTGALNI
jgi:hypothetical protein